MEIFEMEKEFDELMKKGQELIEKMKKERVANTTKTKRWKPKDGELCYFITATGCIGNFYFSSKDSLNCKHYKIGNCFNTKEEAQKELDRRIAEQELLDLADWEDGACAEIMYDLEDKKFSVGFPCTENCYSPYRFATKESAKKTMDTIGEDKLKLIFRIDK